MKLYPAPGATVLHPGTFAPLSAAGEDVPESEYWMRRLADGDVQLEKPKPKRARGQSAKTKNS